MKRLENLFAWVGALGGGLGGWVVPRGGPAQKVYMPSFRNYFPASCIYGEYIWFWLVLHMPHLKQEIE
jgi:hypothetical protein